LLRRRAPRNDECCGAKPIEDRPDVAILEMKDLGDNVFDGG